MTTRYIYTTVICPGWEDGSIYILHKFLSVFINLLLKGECIPPEVGFLQGLPCYQKVGPWHSFWGECLKMSVLTQWSTFKCLLASHPGQKTVVYIYRFDILCVFINLLLKGECIPPKVGFLQGLPCYQKVGPWHSFWGECLKMSVFTDWTTFKCLWANRPGQKTVVKNRIQYNIIHLFSNYWPFLA